MRRTFVAIAIASILASNCALADAFFTECERLSPADAAVLSVSQLQVRYCEAKQKHAIAVSSGGMSASVDKGANECFAAMKNISKLIAEKGSKVDEKCIVP
jgi:hypothetical protein